MQEFSLKNSFNDCCFVVFLEKKHSGEENLACALLLLCFFFAVVLVPVHLKAQSALNTAHKDTHPCNPVKYGFIKIKNNIV